MTRIPMKGDARLDRRKQAEVVDDALSIPKVCKDRWL